MGRGRSPSPRLVCLDDACGTDDDELWGLTHSGDAPVVSRSPRCVPAVPKGDHDPQGEHSQPEYQSSAKGDGGGTSSRRNGNYLLISDRKEKVVVLRGTRIENLGMNPEELDLAKVTRHTRKLGYSTDDHQSSKAFSVNFLPSYVYPSNAVHEITEHTDVRPKGGTDFIFFTIRVIWGCCYSGEDEIELESCANFSAHAREVTG